ncbi:MAG TPA: hypothetical protein VFI96_01200 [Longimicrobiaceae bacterium]|nr:hypothetical protein [Longimicrobiaceae bacterium]
MPRYHDFDRVRGGWDRGAAPMDRYDRGFRPLPRRPRGNYGYIRAYDVEGGYGYAGQTARIGERPRMRGYDRGFRGPRFNTLPRSGDWAKW